jgi:hypothetical protein
MTENIVDSFSTGVLRSWQKKLGHKQPLGVSASRAKDMRFDDYVRTPDPWQPAWIVAKYFRDR